MSDAWSAGYAGATPEPGHGPEYREEYLDGRRQRLHAELVARARTRPTSSAVTVHKSSVRAGFSWPTVGAEPVPGDGIAIPCEA